MMDVTRRADTRKTLQNWFPHDLGVFALDEDGCLAAAGATMADRDKCGRGARNLFIDG